MSNRESRVHPKRWASSPARTTINLGSRLLPTPRQKVASVRPAPNEICMSVRVHVQTRSEEEAAVKLKRSDTGPLPALRPSIGQLSFVGKKLIVFAAPKS